MIQKAVESAITGKDKRNFMWDCCKEKKQIHCVNWGIQLQTFREQRGLSIVSLVVLYVCLFQNGGGD